MLENDVIVDKTRQFLKRYIGSKNIDTNEEIFSTGMVNSLFAMQLILFLEKEFKIKIENEDLDLKNFNSLNSIAKFVVSRFSG
jgi:methoxymalonate biosynthesis acyl carrier protein